MPRKKVHISYITNDANRRASFRKRKKGLIKKANELNTLCGVDVCLVIYGPYDREPEVWPSRSGALFILDRFNELPEAEREVKMMDMTSLAENNIRKLQDQVHRVRKLSASQAIVNHMHACRAGMKSVHDQFGEVCYASDMNFVISDLIRSVKSKMDTLKGGEQDKNVSSSAATFFNLSQSIVPHYTNDAHAPTTNGANL